MRRILFFMCVVALLGMSRPAEAQLRTEAQTEKAPVKLYDQGDTGFHLNELFSPEHFQMSHSFEMSAGSWGGGYSYGMYTNSLKWQFNQKLAARVDVSYMQDFGGTLGMQRSAGLSTRNGGRLFLRNAEIAYRPAENVQLHLQVRQSPYGSYMSPYGQGMYRRHALNRSQSNMFWNGQ